MESTLAAIDCLEVAVSALDQANRNQSHTISKLDSSYVEIQNRVNDMAKKYNNMELYHDIEYLTQSIKQSELLCVFIQFYKYSCWSTSVVLFDQNASKWYYEIVIVCNDDYGTHKCDQWYSLVTIDPLDELHNQYTLFEVNIKNVSIY